jgi:hypothetical protein
MKTPEITPAETIRHLLEFEPFGGPLTPAARQLLEQALANLEERFTDETFPANCPTCAAPKVDGFVDGYLGRECGSKSFGHHCYSATKLRFSQSIPCAVRAERQAIADMLTTGDFCWLVDHMQGVCDCTEIREAIEERNNDRAKTACAAEPESK